MKLCPYLIDPGCLQQTALFVIPTMVILGWILDKPLALLFDPFESVVSTQQPDPLLMRHSQGY